MKILEKLFKWFLLSVFRIMLSRPVPVSSPDTWKSFKKIMVFRLDNRLGNCLLILPLVQAIKQSLPRVHLTVLMTGRFTEIYENHFCVDQVIPYDQNYLFKLPWRMIGLLKKLRKLQFDLVISSSNPDTFSVSQALVSRIISPARSAGFKWRESYKFYTDVVQGRGDIFYGDAQVDLWRYFDARANYTPPEIYMDEDNTGSTDREVLIWLGARAGKLIPEVLLNRIINLLDKRQLDYSFAAGPGDGKIIGNYSSELFRRATLLSRDLRNTVRYFRRFKLLIMPDTGPMHLAAALNIPLIQIFINSNWIRYGYKSKIQFILRPGENLSSLEEFLDAQLEKMKSTIQEENTGV